jgi:hypothetical protein
MEPTKEGSVARKIEVTETGEVSELPTYTKVVEEMYGEVVKLLELHGKLFHTYKLNGKEVFE